MINISELKSLMDKKELYKALTILTNELQILQKGRFSEFKKQLQEVSSIEDFQVLLQLLDRGLMFTYSSFISRYTHKRFNSLQTAVWFCEELIDEGKPLIALETITKYMTEQEAHSSKDVIEKALFCKVRSLMELKRLKEAELFIQEIVDRSSKPNWDRLGYFYLQSGNRAKAEEYLLKGLTDPERGYISFLLLSDLKASNGKHEEALKVLFDGEAAFPNTPSFLLEKVRRYRDIGNIDGMRREMAALDNVSPLHSYKEFFSYLRAMSFYLENNITGLEDYLKAEDIKDTPFSSEQLQPGSLIKVDINPIIQKSNYCVPASLEMILKGYDQVLSQDEIAEHIFDVTGSKLSTTVTYLESLGYETRYFIGTKELYVHFLKNNIPILLSVDFEHSSHVQVMTGYDERFGLYHIQDPNLLETLYIKEEDLLTHNITTSYLSIVAVPYHTKDTLKVLSADEDIYFRKLHDLAEKMEEDEKKHVQDFKGFLQNNLHYDYTPIYVIRHFVSEENKDLLEDCLTVLLEKHDQDFFKLHGAQALIRINDMEKAKELLTQVVKKQFSPLYQFLNGRIALYNDSYKEAIEFFRQSIQLDPDQFYIWGYMALCFLYNKEADQALALSEIAISLTPEDRFALMNHAAVLIEREEYQQARKIYDSLIVEDRKDGYVWYERARLDQKLGRLRKALRGLSTSITLEPGLPYAYLAIADLYENELEDKDRTEEILLTGLRHVQGPQIFIRTGDFYREQENWENALAYYQKSMESYPKERFAYLGYAQVIAELHNVQEASAFLRDNKSLFLSDSEYFINSGRLLAEWAGEAEDLEMLEEGLQLLGEGIEFVQQNVIEVLEMYVDFISGSPFLESGIEFLQRKSTSSHHQLEYLCYLGVLQEQSGRFPLAIEAYQTALEQREDSFPYYRLGEVYFQHELFEEAKVEFLNCLNVNPAVEGAYLKLAAIASYEGDTRREADYMLKLLDYDPLRVDIEYLVSILNKRKLANLIFKLKKMEGKVLEVWRLDSLSHAYGVQDNMEEELNLLNQALAIDPMLPELRHHAVKILVRQRNWKQAKLNLASLLKDHVEKEELYETLIKLFTQSGKWYQLPDYLKKIKKAEEEKCEIFINAASALEQFIKIQDWESEEDGNVVVKLLRRFKRKTRYVMMLGMKYDLFKAAIKLDPFNHNAISRFAVAYESDGLVEDAKKLLQAVIDDEWDEGLAYQLGMLYLTEDHENRDEAQELNNAYNLFKKCYEQGKGDTHLLHMMAVACVELENYSEAEELFKKVISLNPYERRAHLSYGSLLNKLERYSEAKVVLDEGKTFQPFETALYIEEGIAYNKLGDTRTALRLMDELISREELNLVARYNRACYLAILGELEASRTELEFVFEQDEEGYFLELSEDDEDLINLKAAV